MPTLKSTNECDDIAEKVIADYVRACGAYGNPVAIAKVIELLISKAAIGIAMVGSEPTAQRILDRTKRTTAMFAEVNLRSAN
ncbi:hypothetical protein [Burkholderia glumae]|uniref:hypothetical protein n=1 Tax=Burkholderia glumae TaxID=337 RepID=UPI0002F59155|nr:hypothetical protein [Burkholderia glumae]QGA37550.1 hypothetical protein GAS19_07740 [Burkholderia glumae]UVS87034.1 hypothetical protein EFP18_23425 [Burkholderia glumae]